MATGRKLPCKDVVGGIKTVYFADYGTLGTLTITAGTLTAVSNAGTNWYKYEVKGGNNLEQTITSSDENGTTFYAQTLTTVLTKMDVATQVELQKMISQRPHCFVEDNNGNYFAIGQDVSVLNQPGIGIKPNYVSNSFISFSFLLANQTYDSLGTWPQGFARSWVGSTNVGESIFISVLPTTPNVNINIFESSNNVYADVSGQVSQNWNVDGNLYSFGPGNLLQSGPIASSRQIQFGSASVGFQSYPIYVYPLPFGNLFKVANTG